MDDKFAYESVIVFTRTNSYGGPGHQLVTDEWKVDFNWVMATRLGVAVLEVDGAGSGGRGEGLRTMVKYKIGGPEVSIVYLCIVYSIRSIPMYSIPMYSTYV